MSESASRIRSLAPRACFVGVLTPPATVAAAFKTTPRAIRTTGARDPGLRRPGIPLRAHQPLTGLDGSARLLE